MAFCWNVIYLDRMHQYKVYLTCVWIKKLIKKSLHVVYLPNLTFWVHVIKNTNKIWPKNLIVLQEADQNDMYTAIKQVDTQRAESEKIRIWREEQKEILVKKGNSVHVWIQKCINDYLHPRYM